MELRESVGTELMQGRPGILIEKDNAPSSFVCPFYSTSLECFDKTLGPIFNRCLDNHDVVCRACLDEVFELGRLRCVCSTCLVGKLIGIKTVHVAVPRLRRNINVCHHG